VNAVIMAPGQPWGTITKPTDRFFGHQMLSANEVEDISERLYSTKIGASKDARKKALVEKRTLSKSQVNALLERIATKEETFSRTPDKNRTSPHKKVWGPILNSYPWNGQNHKAILCGEESP